MNVYQVVGTGFGVVLAAMAALSLLCFVLRSFGARTALSVQPSEHSSVPDEHLIVLLTAAASETLRARVALYSVQLVPVPDAEGWTRAGRMDLMLSHRVERKR